MTTSEFSLGRMIVRMGGFNGLIYGKLLGTPGTQKALGKRLLLVLLL